MLIGSLCSGYGGLDMAVQAVLGGDLAWVSEYEPHTEKQPRPKQSAAKVLAYRHPEVPNLGDMTAVDWRTIRRVDVLTGGTPCQDVSHAGRRAGMRAGTRSGLWSAMVDAIDVLRPPLVVWENVRGVLSAEADSGMEPCPVCVGNGSGTGLRALGRVLGDLADLGYDTRWVGLPASAVGAPHGRWREFVAAYPSGVRRFEGWRAGPGETPGRWALGQPARRRARFAADPEDHRRSHELAGGYESALAGLAGDYAPAADASSNGRHEGRPEPARQLGRPDAAVSCDIAWGPYEPAIRRWERVLGRPAPTPRVAGRLNPQLSEWMMGLSAGWVTDVPGLTRSEQLHVLGNGVVPQQGAAALRHMLEAS